MNVQLVITIVGAILSLLAAVVPVTVLIITTRNATKENQRLIELLAGRVKKGFAQVDAHFERLEASIDERFAKVDARFDKVDERFDKVDERFDKVDERFEKVDERFDGLEVRLRGVENGLTEVKGQLRTIRAVQMERKNPGSWYREEEEKDLVVAESEADTEYNAAAEKRS